MSARIPETPSLTEADLDAQAALAFVKRTRSMSDRETLEYVADTLAKIAAAKPQRRNK